MNPVQLAFHLASDTGAFPIALGAELSRDASAFGDHPLIDSFFNLTHVIDPLDVDIDELDAEIPQNIARAFGHQKRQPFTSQALL